MVFVLNNSEITELMRETAGQGGWQSLIKRLQSKLSIDTGEIKLSEAEIERIHRYAFDYGDGGFEARLRRIFERRLGPKLLG